MVSATPSTTTTSLRFISIPISIACRHANASAAKGLGTFLFITVLDPIIFPPEVLHTNPELEVVPVASIAPFQSIGQGLIGVSLHARLRFWQPKWPRWHTPPSVAAQLREGLDTFESLELLDVASPYNNARQ
ncbi:hypothetical protein EPI10_015587 [Gossypium australe]|uniref:Uncharacterized protein n=1 Tax=Gossypium australe TaxID=47621 RepID=A0A5B6VLA4_9ROSI|nr:hypothetical protein EPI10_015587 [Gossypium australe]